MNTTAIIRKAILGCALFAVAATSILPAIASAQTGPNGPTRTPDRSPTPTECPAYNREALDVPYVFRYGVDGDSLQKDFYGDSNVANDGSYNDAGYRPTRLTGYTDNGQVEFATKWVKSGGPKWSSKFGLTSAQFAQRFLDMKADGYRIVDASGYNTPSGAVRYADIWEKNTTGIGWAVTRDVPLGSLNAKAIEMQGKGMAPTRIEGYTIPDKGTHFIIVWTSAPNCRWDLKADMTGADYQAHFALKSASMRPVHVDSYLEGAKFRFASIFWAQSGPGFTASHGHHWYLFQRLFNNNACDGFVIDNFYGMEGADGWNTFGAIWSFNAAPNIDENSSLSRKVSQAVNCTDGRGGAAVINLTTGESVMSHADQVFGTASSIKAIILYSLLKKADAEGTNLNTTTLNVGAQYGTNNGNLLTANQSYTLQFLATIMLTNSHNWATNRLIDYVGRDVINQDIDDLGLKVTTLNRYMSGTGSPSAWGNANWFSDYQAGKDNFTTPRELATFYQLVWENNGLLTNAARDNFFAIADQVGLASDNLYPGGFEAANLVDYGKAGSMNYSTLVVGDTPHRPQLGGYIMNTEGGLIEFNNGQVVVYAVLLDERDVASDADAIQCIGLEIAREWSGVALPAMQAICQQ